MGLAERRKALGYSQEKLAQLLGVDRTTVGRWESCRIEPQPPQRRGLASALEVTLIELDALLPQPRAVCQEATGQQSSDHPGAGDPDEMIRREFLRILTVSGALTALPLDEAEALTEGVRRGAPSDFSRMNGPPVAGLPTGPFQGLCLPHRPRPARHAERSPGNGHPRQLPATPERGSRPVPTRRRSRLRCQPIHRRGGVLRPGSFRQQGRRSLRPVGLCPGAARLRGHVGAAIPPGCAAPVTGREAGRERRQHPRHAALGRLSPGRGVRRPRRPGRV